MKKTNNRLAFVWDRHRITESGAPFIGVIHECESTNSMPTMIDIEYVLQIIGRLGKNGVDDDQKFVHWDKEMLLIRACNFLEAEKLSYEYNECLKTEGMNLEESTLTRDEYFMRHSSLKDVNDILVFGHDHSLLIQVHDLDALIRERGEDPPMIPRHLSGSYQQPENEVGTWHYEKSDESNRVLCTPYETRQLIHVRNKNFSRFKNDMLDVKCDTAKNHFFIA